MLSNAVLAGYKNTAISMDKKHLFEGLAISLFWVNGHRDGKLT